MKGKLRGTTIGPPTKQEHRVIALLADGKSSKEIASILGISVTTVDTHRVNLYRRMGFPSIVDVVHWALAKGLIQNKYKGE
jgi:DNA-binding CsgD family transcriptional regulator